MKRLTYEFIKGRFEKEGYELLSGEYVNAHKKLKCRCNKGHVRCIAYNDFKRGNKCAVCSYEDMASKRRLDSNYIINSFKKEGYVLLPFNYKNCSQKLYYICPQRHRHCISWASWQQGSRCPYCNGRPVITIDIVRKSFEKEGYQLLTKEYINNKQKLEYICTNGHKHSIYWSSWRQGQRCPYCAGLIKPVIEFIRSEFEKEGYVLLTKKYINAHHTLFYICSEGHEHVISWSDWQQGRRCPTCAIINNSGKNHYNWKGGISCEPYCDVWLDKEFKKSILERDNYQCQNPDCWQTSKRLTIHHIDYNKKNCRPKNLITLCVSCNVRANKNRNYWRGFYNTILYKKAMLFVHSKELKPKMKASSEE